VSTPEEKRDPWDRFLGWLDRAATWPQRGSLGRRLLLLVLSVAVIVGLVLFVSNNWWRDDIPRSAIAAVALGLGVLIALWLFGTRGSNVALSILAAIGAILIAAGTALDLDEVLSDGPPPKGALVDCPDFPDGFDGIVAPTEIGYAHLRAEPNLHSDVLLRYPPGCRLAFDRYCLGEPKDDWRFDVLDPVWLRVRGGDGYVASADLKVGPPRGSVPRGPCVQDRRGPTPPALTAPLSQRLKGPVEIAASAPRAIQVGFAVYYRDLPGEPGSATWHQIGVDLNTGDGVTTTWDSRSVPGQSRRRAASVSLMAVPCLGLEFPALRPTTHNYFVANRGRPSAPPMLNPSPESKDLGRQIACDNVER
jgi:hypothetical protein